jgi:lipid II:glycine glycyltransferase (peptidoglycan interpeptide bridge formation enzyme)
VEYLFLAQLSEDYYKQIKVLFEQIEFSSIEQCPGFSDAAYPNEKIIHALFLSNNEIKGYAQIKIKKHILASVYFGPLIKTESDYELFIKEIKKYCKRKFIPVLKILPPHNTIKYQSSFWEQLKADTNFETCDNEFNWSTLISKINLTDEELLKSFADNHRQSIKKAMNIGFKTTLLNQKDIDTFNNQYCEMYTAKGLPINITNNFQKFTRLFQFFEEHKNGFFMGVWLENKLIGGVCISFGNNVAFYLEGYSHPDYRKLPVSHLALYESMKLARDNGLNYFDFGGYANNTVEGDQLYNINKFKEGFRGELIYYPKTMIFYTSLPVKWMYKLFLLLRK